MTVRNSLEAYATELARTKESLGKRQTSVWTMSKAELSELARKELGMTVTQANKETVITLREKIRAVRQITKVQVDPLATAPKGLEKMSLTQLKEEVVFRKLPEPPSATRAKLIVIIRDDVEARIVLETREERSTIASSSTTMPRGLKSPKQEEDEDWEMPTTPKTKKR